MHLLNGNLVALLQPADAEQHLGPAERKVADGALGELGAISVSARR